MNKEQKNDKVVLLDHLMELRVRIIISLAIALVGGVISFFFSKEIVTFLVKPLLVLNSASDQFLYINNLVEGFLTRVKISILSGLILTSPVHLYNIVSFVFPGLKRKEKNYVIIGIVISIILIGLSFYYSYYKIIPISIMFLTGNGNIPDNIGVLLNYTDNIFIILQFIIVAVVIFQLPILLEILLMLGVLKRKKVMKSGRYIIISIFILSAIFTPPDFISQISLALPLILLFYVSLFIATIFKWGEE